MGRPRKPLRSFGPPWVRIPLLPLSRPHAGICSRTPSDISRTGVRRPVPEIVEGDAVEERGAVDDETVDESHDPRVAVVVRALVVGDAMAVPHDDDHVAVGDDRAD